MDSRVDKHIHVCDAEHHKAQPHDPTSQNVEPSPGRPKIVEVKENGHRHEAHEKKGLLKRGQRHINFPTASPKSIPLGTIRKSVPRDAYEDRGQDQTMDDLT